MRQSWRSVATLPGVRILLGVAAGILLQWYTPLNGTVILTSASVLTACAFVSLVLASRYRKFTPVRDIAVVGLLILIGMLRTADVLESRSRDLLPFAERKERVQLIGVVSQHPSVYPDKRRFRLDCRILMTEDSLPVAGTVLATYRRSAYDPSDTLSTVRIGDVVRLRCKLRLPLTPRNPGGFDTRQWLLEEGSVLLCSVSKGSDLRVIGYEHPGAMAAATGIIRRGLRAAISQLYQEAHAAIMVGLLLGDRGMIDTDIMGDFRDTGIMHILAVSGLHAGIILMMVFMPLERLPYALRAVLALAVLWLFASVTGFAPPVTRAATMATLFLGGVVLQRGGNSLNALAAAGAIIVLVNPVALFGLSFQLSFGAVLGILLFQERVQQALLTLLPRGLRSAALRSVAGLLSLTISAQILTLPQLVTAFGQFSPAGLLANLIAVPMVFLAVTSGVLSLLAYAALPALAAAFAAVADSALDIIMFTSKLLAALPGAAIAVPALPGVAAVAYFACIVYFIATEGRMRQKVFLVSIVVIATVVMTAAVGPSDDGALRVTFLDVGQGDAAVVELPDGSAVLIDTGPSGGSSDAGKAVILPFLRNRGITSLHSMVITHPDNDHAGGARSVMEELPVQQVLISCRWPQKEHVQTLLQYMYENADSVRDVRSGDRIALPGSVNMYVLSPPAGVDCEASNEHSVVLLLVYGSTRFLFTGDADAEAEHRMIARYDSFLHADVLKVGHHGSTTSSSPGFVVKVRPRHAVISAGRNNHFNHPRQEILDRLRLSGAHVSRTDVEGAITFVSDGSKVEKVITSR